MLILKHPEDLAPLAYISESHIEFTERGKPIRDRLHKDGINIPPKSQGIFSGRTIIYYNPNKDDPFFIQAFKDIYFPATLRESGFKLEKE